MGREPFQPLVGTRHTAEATVSGPITPTGDDMALRDKIAKEAASHLEPGEQIHVVFAGQTASPYWSLLSYWIVFAKDAYRAIVATDRRIVVFRTSRWRWTKFKRIERLLPRDIGVPDPSGLNWKTDAFGETMWINKRFHKDVRALATPAVS